MSKECSIYFVSKRKNSQWNCSIYTTEFDTVQCYHLDAYPLHHRHAVGDEKYRVLKMKDQQEITRKSTSCSVIKLYSTYTSKKIWCALIRTTYCSWGMERGVSIYRSKLLMCYSSLSKWMWMIAFTYGLLMWLLSGHMH